MAVIVTQIYTDKSATMYRYGYSYDMNGETSGSCKTDLQYILHATAPRNSFEADAVQLAINSNNGTEGSANGYIYLGGDADDKGTFEVVGRY